ncbi:MAG: protease inhibitor I42 family protein [Candidatus Omnitrophota bacterium]
MRISIAALLILMAIGQGFICAEPAEDKEYELINNIVETYVGENFTIELKSNITTGYSWKIVTLLDPDRIVLTSAEYVTGNKRLPGAGGREKWKFRAIAPGRFAITFEYARPWEIDIPPAEKQTYGIIIKEKKN